MLINVITLLIQGVWTLNESNQIKTLAPYKGQVIRDITTGITSVAHIQVSKRVCIACHGTGENPNSDSFAYCISPTCVDGEQTIRTPRFIPVDVDVAQARMDADVCVCCGQDYCMYTTEVEDIIPTYPTPF